jgi:4-amino-4-deoxy-L-arabinose transferase-like glycosyltransferase
MSGFIPSSSARWCLPCLAFAASLLLFLIGITQLPLTDRDETRFSEATREMIERGDPLVPWFNDVERFDKPPLFYWLQATGWRVFGVSDATARLPSVFCAALTVMASALWARRIAGERAGWFAFLILVTVPQLHVHARLAVADMPMILSFVLASWSGWELARPAHSPHWNILLIGSLATGFLAKGPVAWLPVVPGFLMAWNMARTSASPAAIRTLIARWVLIGTATVALIALWAIPALLATHGRFLTVGIGKHVIGRSLNILEGHGLRGVGGYLGSLPFYFLTLIPGFLPWSVPLLRNLFRIRPWQQLDLSTGALLGGAALVFITFTLLRTKLPHYTLPAFPLLAIWLAVQLHQQSVPTRPVLRTAAITAAVLSTVFLVGTSVLSRFMPVPRLVAAARPWLTPQTEVASVKFNEPSLVWNFRSITRSHLRFIEPADAAAFLAQAGPRACVLEEGPLAAQLRTLPQLHEVAVEGINFVNGRRLRLVALIRHGTATDANPTPLDTGLSENPTEGPARAR